MESVIIVRKMVDAVAGSAPRRFMRSGNVAPEMVPMVSATVMAIAETAPNCHSTRPEDIPMIVTASPTKNPATRPFTSPTKPSRRIRR